MAPWSQLWWRILRVSEGICRETVSPAFPQPPAISPAPGLLEGENGTIIDGAWAASSSICDVIWRPFARKVPSWFVDLCWMYPTRFPAIPLVGWLIEGFGYPFDNRSLIGWFLDGFWMISIFLIICSDYSWWFGRNPSPWSAVTLDGGMYPTSRRTEKSIITGQNNAMFTTNDWEW